MICPQCGKVMIKRYDDTIILVYPPVMSWVWWCACGHTEAGGEERGLTTEEMYRQQWEDAHEEAQ